MTSRCQDMKQRIDSIDVCSRSLPASHILKSQDCADDSIALTDKLPKKAVSTVILEIDRGEEESGDAISKVATLKKIVETSYCDDRSRDQSVIFIKCAATPCKDFLSAQYSDTDVSRQKSKATSSPPDCKFACSDQEIDISSEMDDAFSQITCRKGADSSEISSSSKKSLKRFKRRIYPTSCCRPVQQTTIKEACKDFLHAKFSASDATFVGKDDKRSLDEQQLQCPVSERMLRTKVTRVESAKSDKASTCQRSATASRDACLIPGRISEETSPLSSSQDLIARYKKHIPIHLLEKYEICRSRRNGLQDECVLPFLQTIFKKEGRTWNNCIEHKRSIEQID